MTGGRLRDVAPHIERLLVHGGLATARFGVADISCRTDLVATRDGTLLATDLYLPPAGRYPAAVMRTPYGRANDKLVGTYMTMARRGYAVVVQDVRGTGSSEPATWDYYMYEAEDSVDLVSWIVAQPWSDGFIGGCGGSYPGQMQWCMALHPAMRAIVPEVSGLGVSFNSANQHMTFDAYARTVGKGAGKIAMHYSELERQMHSETLSGGLFDEPVNAPLPGAARDSFPTIATLPRPAAELALWDRYCAMNGAERAAFVRRSLNVESVSVADIERLAGLFGRRLAHDAYTIPASDPATLAAEIHAVPLLVTGWYDWALNDALATWKLLRAHGRPGIGDRARLLVAPSAHNQPGYLEGLADHPELREAHRTARNAGLIQRWYEAVAADDLLTWPPVIYYLMGANEWRTAADWPPPETKEQRLYLGANGTLGEEPPDVEEGADIYVYDPLDPTPTVGGSVVSGVYPAGSVDVSGVQGRADILVYTTPPLHEPLEIVGPMRVLLHVSSSAVDTDFTARLSDVFPDGRAVQLQAGILRARYRDPAAPVLLEPGRIYELEIDLWSTANRFAPGHCVRLDIASADFPRFDRNSNAAGNGPPVRAEQTVYRHAGAPSCLIYHARPLSTDPTHPANNR